MATRGRLYIPSNTIVRQLLRSGENEKSYINYKPLDTERELVLLLRAVLKPLPLFRGISIETPSLDEMSYPTQERPIYPHELFRVRLQHGISGSADKACIVGILSHF